MRELLYIVSSCFILTLLDVGSKSQNIVNSQIIQRSYSNRSLASHSEASSSLLVAISNCRLNIEFAHYPLKCSHRIAFRAREFSFLGSLNCNSIRSHLLLHNEYPLKILLFGSNQRNGYMSGKIINIRWSGSKWNDSREIREDVVTMNSEIVNVDRISYGNVVATIVDYRYRILYVLLDFYRESVKCVLFYMRKQKGQMLTFSRIGTFMVHPRNKKRLLWTEDGYTNRVYYVEWESGTDETSVYSVELHSIVSVLMYGYEGRRELIVTGRGVAFTVSNGFAISYVNKNGYIKQFIHKLSKRSNNQICEDNYRESNLPPSARHWLLLPEAHCRLLKNTSEANQCYTNVCATSSIALGNQKVSLFENLAVYLTFIVILLTGIIILIICLKKCHRKGADFSIAIREMFTRTFISESTFEY